VYGLATERSAHHRVGSQIRSGANDLPAAAFVEAFCFSGVEPQFLVAEFAAPLLDIDEQRPTHAEVPCWTLNEHAGWPRSLVCIGPIYVAPAHGQRTHECVVQERDSGEWHLAAEGPLRDALLPACLRVGLCPTPFVPVPSRNPGHKFEMIGEVTNRESGERRPRA